MKNICIIAGSLNDHHILKPLIKEIQNDASVYLTVISSGKHLTQDMEIHYRRLEEEGYPMDEETNIRIISRTGYPVLHPADFKRLAYETLLKKLAPDIVVLFGNSYDTLSAAIAASLSNIPIAHIKGGESDFRTWDDAYGFGITKMSHLHFTETMKYRQQVIRLGEHSDRVFNVGSLLVQKIKTQPEKKKDLFYHDMGLEKQDQFILVSFHPDAAIGSKNRELFQEVMDSLGDDRLKNFKLLFNKPGTGGLGKMISDMIDGFIELYPERCLPCPLMNLTDFSRAVQFSAALVGNSSDGMTIAPSFKTPVINIGTRQKDRIHPGNMIDCRPPKKETIVCAIQNGLSADFRYTIRDLLSPFEKQATAFRIKEIIKSFHRSDITKKEFFAC